MHKKDTNPHLWATLVDVGQTVEAGQRPKGIGFGMSPSFQTLPRLNPQTEIRGSYCKIVIVLNKRLHLEHEIKPVFDQQTP